LFLFVVSAAFPETQKVVLVAAQGAGVRRAAGEASSSYFSMDDHLATMHARITPITKLGHELRLAAEDLYRLLWPTETLPVNSPTW
jgi:hypothetical protein